MMAIIAVVACAMAYMSHRRKKSIMTEAIEESADAFHVTVLCVLMLEHRSSVSRATAASG